MLCLWFRYFPYVGLNEFLFDRICRRYINWRDFIVPTTTPQGAKFSCRLGDTIQRNIFYFGVWEPHITAYILSNIDENDLFVDVGSNIGYYTVITGKRCGKVVSIEASPKIYAELKNNLALNDLANVRAVNIAVGEKRDEVSIYSGPASNIGATTTLKDRANGRNALTFETNVPSLPIGQVLTDAEKKEARFIKIDIEGAEYPVLKNIFEHVSHYREDVEIVVEFSPKDCRKFGGSPQEFLAKAKEAGFFVYQIRNKYKTFDYTNRVEFERPHRIKALPGEQVDLVLSRRNTTVL